MHSTLTKNCKTCKITGSATRAATHAALFAISAVVATPSVITTLAAIPALVIPTLAVAAPAVQATVGAVSTPDISVSGAWARATVPQQKASGAFFTIVAKTSARLVGVTASVAGVAEIHEMKMENHIMRMGAVTGIDLPAGTPVELKSGGYHVMLMDLKQQLKEGETLRLALTVEYSPKPGIKSGTKHGPNAQPQRETIEIIVPIRSLTGKAGSMPRHADH